MFGWCLYLCCFVGSVFSCSVMLLNSVVVVDSLLWFEWFVRVSLRCCLLFVVLGQVACD